LDVQRYNNSPYVYTPPSRLAKTPKGNQVPLEANIFEDSPGGGAQLNQEQESGRGWKDDVEMSTLDSEDTLGQVR